MPKRHSASDPFVISLHPRQLEVFHSPARFRILVAGRRFGKTYLALAEMLREARQGNRIIWYVGPNDQQAKRVAWDRLKFLTRHLCSKRPNETQLRIDLPWNSTLFVSGAFNPDSLRGTGIDFLVMDEFASHRPEAWNEVFRPALADRKGRALFIGTPKGHNHFFTQFEFAKTDPDWQTFQFTTAQGGLVAHDELVSAARQLDPESYRQEFEAAFTSHNLNRVYYPFDRATHVRKLSFENLHPLVWSLDFNVNPMCMLLMQRIADTVHVLEEIVIKPAANTEAACQAFHKRAFELSQTVPHHQRPFEIEIYGDASGNQRRTSGADTDWALIRQFFALWKGTYNAKFHTVTVNPAVRDRVNCVNSRLRNQLSETHLFIDPACRELIKDLEDVSWALNDIDKADRARTHTSDALGYYLSQAFNLKPIMGHQPQGRVL